MDIVEIKKVYPTAYTLFNKFLLKPIPSANDWTFIPVNEYGILYQFFDSNYIHIGIKRNILSSIADDSVYLVSAYIDGKYIGMKDWKGNIHTNRHEAEVLAFAEAFKILEKKLKKDK